MRDTYQGISGLQNCPAVGHVHRQFPQLFHIDRRAVLLVMSRHHFSRVAPFVSLALEAYQQRSVSAFLHLQLLGLVLEASFPPFLPSEWARSEGYAPACLPQRLIGLPSPHPVRAPHGVEYRYTGP